MKNLILILAPIFLCLSSFAQNIKKNEINEHGVRIIEADMSVVIEDGMYLGVGLEYHNASQLVENYYITILVPKGAESCEIKKDQQIKFKTINDEAVIGLSTKDFPCVLVGGKWSYVATYVVSPETIEKLSQQVSKIRINYTTPEKASFFDIDTSDGIMTRYFKRAYANIKKTIPQPADKDRSVF